MFPQISYIFFRNNELKSDIFLADISAFPPGRRPLWAGGRIPISEFVHMDVF